MLETSLLALAYAALVGLAFAPLEQLFRLRSERRARWTTDLLFATVGHVGTRLLLLYGLGALLTASTRIASEVGLGAASPLADLPAPLRIGVGLLLFELTGYGYHRLAHRVPLLWRLHRVHHSAPTMDWLASFRQHPLEIVAMTLAQNLPLVVLGLPLGEHTLVVMLLALNTVFVHGNLRVPRALEAFVATPRFHHRHHDAERPTANFASLFPWLDRLFGTHDAADAGRVGLEDGADAGFVDLLLTRTPTEISERGPV
ncbi:MAG: sterol desaturase family protein [Sandaracinaceae bacterium]|nr:sterol desaturase family protein [Sandaracinaceae bacterium]